MIGFTYPSSPEVDSIEPLLGPTPRFPLGTITFVSQRTSLPSVTVFLSGKSLSTHQASHTFCFEWYWFFVCMGRRSSATDRASCNTAAMSAWFERPERFLGSASQGGFVSPTSAASATAWGEPDCLRERALGCRALWADKDGRDIQRDVVCCGAAP